MATVAPSHVTNAAPVQNAAPVLRESAEALNYRKVTDLRKLHLQEQNTLEKPSRHFTFSAALLGAVAVAIFANLSAFATVVVGVALYNLAATLQTFYVNKYIDSSHRQAANFLLSPGFYDWAFARNPRDLGSAQNIVATHTAFLALR